MPHSAVQYVRDHLGLKVSAIAKLEDLLAFLGQGSAAAEMREHHSKVLAYRERYGVRD